MSEFTFKNIGRLQRDRTIEGETGTELAVGDVTLRVLAGTDANPRYRQWGEDWRNELKRLSRANASEERVKKFQAEWFTRMFVLDWPKPPLDGDGHPVPFSKEACEAFLFQADDVIPAILDIVFETKMFRGARVEAIVGTAKN